MVDKKGKRFTIDALKRTLVKILLKINGIWLPFDFLRWVVIDKLRQKKDEIRLSGMDIIIGKTGSGKTLALCERAARLRKEHPEVIILTNFYWSGQDAQLTSYKQIDRLPEYGDWPVCIYIDEIQKEFAADNFKNFPPTLFDVISEARKLNIRIEATTQYLRFADNRFREYAHTVTEVRNILRANRLFETRTYDKDDWLRKDATKDNQYPPKIDVLEHRLFVAGDDIYNMYDTYAKSESIRKTTYDNTINYYEQSVKAPAVNLQIDKKSYHL